MTRTELLYNITEYKQDRISLKAIIADVDAYSAALLQQANVSGRSELLFAFIQEIKNEFADENWDYLDYIAERVLSKQ